MPYQGKLVLFGAGKIGRSFIGQLFSRSGYEIVFVDIFEPVINELNNRGNYKVIIKAEKEESITVHNVRGLLLSQASEISEEIATADVLAVSVGQQGLPGALEQISAGLMLRYKKKPQKPIDIIIAENMRNADVYFREELTRQLPPSYPFQDLVGLVETSIGKMVPIMTPEDVQQDILQVFAEPYNTLILDKKGFKNPIPQVEGLAPKENMKAWVDRKSFIHNLGHAVVSYAGFVFNPKWEYLWQALENEKLFRFTRNCMLQSANILMSMYPNEFTQKALEDHIDDLLHRFQNKALGDTIFRVGCDLQRKLSREDRLFGAILQGFQRGLPYDKLLCAAICGFYFKGTDSQRKMHPGDVDFHNMLSSNIYKVLYQICGLNPTSEKEIIDKACAYYGQIQKGINFDDINS